MGPHNITDEDAAAAIERDLVRHVSLVYAPPIGEVHEEEELVWFRGGVADQYQNGILRGPQPSSTDDVRAAIEPFAKDDLPMMWWIFTPPAPFGDESHEALTGAGCTLDSDRPGMWLPLEELPDKPKPAGASITRVTTTEMFNARTNVVADAFDSPDMLFGPSTRGFLRYGFDGSGPFQHFLCYVGDQAAGTITLTRVGDFVGIANMATRSQWRGRGLGSYLLTQVLQEERATGARAAVLTADELGARLYASLGFRTVSRHFTYVWQPPQ